MNIRKIIKEELLKEVGGYDDPNTMASHTTSSINTLSSAYGDLSSILSDISNSIMDGGLSITESKDYLKDIIESVDEVVMIMQVVLKDFTEDDLISDSKNIIKSLNKFNQKLRVLNNMSDSFAKNDMEFTERIKDLLMDMIPAVQNYGKSINSTISTLRGRFSSFSKGDYFKFN